MRIKTFEALEMADALRAVRDAMGPDAVILSTREVRRKDGEFAALGRPVIEVTAAVDLPDPETAAPRAPMIDLGRIQEQMADMRAMLTTLVRHSGRQRLDETLAGLEPPLRALFAQLTANGIDAPGALELLAEIRQGLAPAELADEARLRRAVRDAIAGAIRTAGPIDRAHGKTKIVMLMGPTGVGKTTTIAKLAAHRVQQREPVTLVTMDTHRVGAVEQIRSYAKTIGAALEPALSMEQLRALLARRQEGGLVLIDTPGRNHLNDAQMDELRSWAQLPLPVERHLVVSSSARPEEVSEMIDRFSVVPIDRLLVTKIDETARHGAIYTAMKRRGTPLSYLTTGQRVPEDIEVATPQRLADLVMH